jgi:hypothetical protein
MKKDKWKYKYVCDECKKEPHTEGSIYCKSCQDKVIKANLIICGFTREQYQANIRNNINKGGWKD